MRDASLPPLQRLASYLPCLALVCLNSAYVPLLGLCVIEPIPGPESLPPKSAILSLLAVTGWWLISLLLLVGFVIWRLLLLGLVKQSKGWKAGMNEAVRTRLAGFSSAARINLLAGPLALLPVRIFFFPKVAIRLEPLGDVLLSLLLWLPASLAWLAIGRSFTSLLRKADRAKSPAAEKE